MYAVFRNYELSERYTEKNGRYPDTYTHTASGSKLNPLTCFFLGWPVDCMFLTDASSRHRLEEILLISMSCVRTGVMPRGDDGHQLLPECYPAAVLAPQRAIHHAANADTVHALCCEIPPSSQRCVEASFNLPDDDEDVPCKDQEVRVVNLRAALGFCFA
jgi:hypothetical protein